MAILRIVSFGTRDKRKFIQILTIFFQVFFKHFCDFLSFSALYVKQPPPGFDSRLLQNFEW